MKKNKNKPETVDTSSVSEAEELNVPRKKKKNRSPQPETILRMFRR